MAPRIQNFSIPAGDPTLVVCDIDPDAGVSLIDATDIVWKMYEQEHGVPTAGVEPVLVKTLDHGTQVEDPDTLKFSIDISSDDTIDKLRNYYHEGHVVDADGVAVHVVYGIVTITQTENRA